MIEYRIGDLFESSSEALVNTVNTVGVMGKGIALQFKNLYPSNYKKYIELCKRGDFQIGHILVVRDHNTLSGEKIILNFPTKEHWRSPSQYDFIEKGLVELKRILVEENIKSVSMPPLGSGNGGLQWHKVKLLIESHLSDLTTCHIIVYEPNSSVKEVLKKERVKLTPARAMLLSMLFELVKNGEFVSEFTSEKLCYFLQRFGAEKHFKLNYTQNFYGPYSGKVRHVLNYLNGSYIMGYSDKDKKPFDELDLVIETEQEVIDYLKENDDLFRTVEQTKLFLNGFYSAFGLELLSTVDFIAQSNKNSDKEFIINQLAIWSDRKKTLFSDQRFIDISLNHLRESKLI